MKKITSIVLMVFLLAVLGIIHNQPPETETQTMLPEHTYATWDNMVKITQIRIYI